MESSSIITVVSGFPRSGTSLMMQMLEAGGFPVWTDGVRAADVDNPHGYYELEAAKALARDASFLCEAHGRAIKLVLPLLSHLPESETYRVICMERALEEVVASQDVMLKRRAELPAPIDPRRLSEIFAQQLAGARAQLTRRGIPLLVVRFEEVLRDPAAVAECVAAFLGVPLDLGAMVRAVDPALQRQRQASPGAAAS